MRNTEAALETYLGLDESTHNERCFFVGLDKKGQKVFSFSCGSQTFIVRTDDFFSVTSFK